MAKGDIDQLHLTTDSNLKLEWQNIYLGNGYLLKKPLLQGVKTKAEVVWSDVEYKLCVGRRYLY